VRVCSRVWFFDVGFANHTPPKTENENRVMMQTESKKRPHILKMESLTVSGIIHIMLRMI
jgi:hypothetical protein